MPWEGLNVLVVEDDIMNRLLFSKILKQAAKLVIAEDGEKGLEVVGDLFKEGKTFDVVLMDINLPDRWDGIKLKNRIQELFSPYRKIPFIAQTAYAMQGDREKFLSEGFNEYISKPIIKKELIRVVIKALDSIK
jgi:CheY-like chemotaxis protein